MRIIIYFFYPFACDHNCINKSLNQKVIQGYIKLVNELVHKPLDNK